MLMLHESAHARETLQIIELPVIANDLLGLICHSDHVASQGHCHCHIGIATMITVLTILQCVAALYLGACIAWAIARMDR